jgi:phosphatidylethanolamine/phosphatidyl-N-methylethanolamine N-methyltransferase
MNFAFFSSLIRNPLRMGAFTPSGPALTRKIASLIDPNLPGPIIELGPGTGEITRELIKRVDESRLILIEADKTFCPLLKEKFPRALILEGDAFTSSKVLPKHCSLPLGSVVSGLPLRNFPMEQRELLLKSFLKIMAPKAPFVQFSYGIHPPVPEDPKVFTCTFHKRVWQNLPPAGVWVYQSK